jgi:hypothetical protein
MLVVLCCFVSQWAFAHSEICADGLSAAAGSTDEQLMASFENLLPQFVQRQKDLGLDVLPVFAISQFRTIGVDPHAGKDLYQDEETGVVWIRRTLVQSYSTTAEVYGPSDIAIRLNQIVEKAGYHAALFRKLYPAHLLNWFLMQSRFPAIWWWQRMDVATNRAQVTGRTQWVSARTRPRSATTDQNVLRMEITW